ncbi:hypothetical protein C8F04DRAFT_987919, partial [Mycena alexandri]
MQRAIKIMEAEEGSSSSPPPSLKTATQQAQRECLQQDKKHISLSTSTLSRRLNGGLSKTEAHQNECWLNSAEADVVISYVIACADRGFPLSHRRLKEHVDVIARARWGTRFPETGVGKQWTKMFVSDHSDRLGMYWSRALDRSRARAVNPITKKEYFD